MTELEARRPVLIDPFDQEAATAYNRWRYFEFRELCPWPRLRRSVLPVVTDQGVVSVVAWSKGWLIEWIHFPPVHAKTLAEAPAYALFSQVAKTLFQIEPIVRVTFAGGRSSDRTKLNRLRISDRCVTHGRLLAGLPPLPLPSELVLQERARKLNDKPERKPDGITANGTPLFG